MDFIPNRISHLREKNEDPDQTLCGFARCCFNPKASMAHKTGHMEDKGIEETSLNISTESRIRTEPTDDWERSSPPNTSDSQNDNDIIRSHRSVKQHKSQKEDIKMLILAWAENTTFHGVRYLFDSRTSKVRRFIWTLLVIGMWCGLVTIGISQYNRYYDYRTNTHDTIRWEKVHNFPSVTLCYNCVHNMSSTYENYQLLRQLDRVKSKEGFEKLKQSFGHTLNDNVTLIELFKELAIPSKRFFYKCLWRRVRKKCWYLWTPVIIGELPCFTFNHISVKRKRKFQTKGTGRYSTGLKMTLFLDNEKCYPDFRPSGVDVLVHERGIYPNMYASRVLSPGLNHQISVKVNEKSFLPPPVKAFGSRACMDTESPDFNNPLEFSPKYSFSACANECLVTAIDVICNCIHPKHPGPMKKCDIVTYNTCVRKTFYRYRAKDSSMMEICGCLKRCKYTSYTTTMSSSNINPYWLSTKPNVTTEQQMKDKEFIRENFVIFDVHFESMVTHVSEQYLDFTLSDLLASIGGYFGLAVGASVLTFFEIFDMLFDVVVRLTRRLKRRKAISLRHYLLPFAKKPGCESTVKRI